MHPARASLEDGVTGFAGWPRRPSSRNPLGLPAPLTWKQLFYIWGPQCLGAAVIDGGANFAIAYAMYSTANRPIRIWPLVENTIAGDLGVTTFIQGILTFTIASAMVHVDLRRRRIDPFPYPWPDQSFGVWRFQGPYKATTRHGKVWRRFHAKHGLGRGLHFFSGSDTQDIFDLSLTWKAFFTRLFWSVWKGSVLSALYWFLWWPIAVAIICPIWGTGPLPKTWAPQIIKLIYGSTLGLAMNPVVACIALGSEDAIRLHLRDEQLAAWADYDKKSTPMTAAERVAPRPSLEVRSRHPSLRDGADSPRASSFITLPTDVVPLSTDVAMLRSSLDLARSPVGVGRSASARSSMDGDRRSFDQRRSARPSFDLPTRPSFDRRSASERSEPVSPSVSFYGDLRPPRPSLERRRTAPGNARETPRSLSLDLARSKVETALASETAEVSSRRSPISARPRVSLDERR